MAIIDIPQAPLNPTNAPSWVHTYASFIKAHERLLGFVIAGGLLFHFYGRAIDAWVDHDKRVLSQSQAIVKVDTTDNKNLLQQLTDLRTQFSKQQIVYVKGIQTTQTNLKQAQTLDQTLPLPQLAQHWETLIATKGVSSNTDGTLTVIGDAGHVTVNELERVPALSSQLAATQSELTSCTTLSNKKDDLVAGLTKAAVDVKKENEDQVKELKAQNHKSFMKGFKYGFITGVAVTTAAVVAILR